MCNYHCSFGKQCPWLLKMTLANGFISPKRYIQLLVCISIPPPPSPPPILLSLKLLPTNQEMLATDEYRPYQIKMIPM